ncbi:MAG TPA: hypothetical protein VGY91_05120, partial [Chthoniobacterales bacterium]|nr:hypothetical protein [Chthoniobacterales bacterium]
MSSDEISAVSEPLQLVFPIFSKQKKAEAVVVMDADGEDRPEDLVRLVEAHSTLSEIKIIFAERTR